MQSREELEEWYKRPDPWSYENTEDDLTRKNIILDMLYKQYNRALDIGCGEGFITRDLPAVDIHGIELSDTAASRLPWIVKRVSEPVGIYDLVITTGTLYQQYDHEKIDKMIKKASCRHVLVAGIKAWLLPYKYGKIIDEKEFTYRQFIQRVTLYEVGA